MARDPLDDQYHGRCLSAEKRQWERAAATDGRSLNNWIRQVLNDAADRQLTEPPKPPPKRK